MTKSKIEWTDETWNPVVGCSIVSRGCTNCYAMHQAHRNAANPATPYYEGTTHRVNGNTVWTGKVNPAPDKTLLAPLRWKKPRMVFVNSMSDLFHEDIPDELIDRIFAVMALAQAHTFQLLTKRAGRMELYLNTPDRDKRIGAAGLEVLAMLSGGDLHKPVIGREQGDILLGLHRYNEKLMRRAMIEGVKVLEEPDPAFWPLPNVWVGVSVEDQRHAEERIPHLLDAEAAVRFISAEPLLGEINLGEVIHKGVFAWFTHNALSGDGEMLMAGHKTRLEGPGLDWVIVGGESGRKARPMHPEWARSLRDQCVVAGVPFFFKQWGHWQDGPGWTADDRAVDLDGGIHKAGKPDLLADWQHGYLPRHRGMTMMAPVGKRSAGRVLDGRTWDEMPAPKYSGASS